MARTVGIGLQDFEQIRKDDLFYVDKTGFIKEWWENKDSVTLITRPRRFGKTLTMSMVEQFFSIHYAGRGDLFEGLSIWEEEAYRNLQGTYPVISLSFANVKEKDYETTKARINQLLVGLYDKYAFLLEDGRLTLTVEEKKYFQSISMDMPEVVAQWHFTSFRNFFSDIMRKKLLYFWMNMIRLCRNPMWMVIGKNWLALPEVCSMLPLRRILIWIVRL